MLTPVELQNISFKTGVGYRKKEVDDLLNEICKDYEILYKENVELKDKVGILSDGLQYYKEMEKTLQKTLVVAEKTAEEMQTTSQAKADLLKQQAKAEAAAILEEARTQVKKIHAQTLALAQQYENYRIQYKRLTTAQMDVLENETYKLDFNLQMPEISVELEQQLRADAFSTIELKEGQEEVTAKEEVENSEIDLENDFTVNIDDSF